MTTAVALIDSVLTALDDALVAGPAAGDGGATLHGHAAALREAGARVPAFVQLADTLAAFAARARADTLLDAVAMARRIRAALAERAPVDPYPLDPLEKTEPLETSLDTAAIAAFRARFEAPGAPHARPGRRECVVDAIERDLVRDLRMLPYWRAALRDPGLENLVLERVVPRLGRAIAADVRARMDGGRLEPRDGVRLVAFASAAPDQARALALEAARSRLPLLRVAGLRALGWSDPAAVEPLALAVLADVRTVPSERAAAADALGRVESDAALTALVRELWQGGPSGDATQLALASARYAPTGARLVAEARALCAPGRALLHADVIVRARLVGLIGRRRPVCEGGLAFLRSHLGPRDVIRDEAARALIALGDRDGLEDVALRLAENDWQSLELALDALMVLDPWNVFARAQPVLAPEATAFGSEAREHATELLMALGRLCATPERPDGSSRRALIDAVRADPSWEAYAATFPREMHAKVEAAARGLVAALKRRPG